MSGKEVKTPKSTFARRAAERRHDGPVLELVEFLIVNKKWWLMPVALAMLALGALVLLSGTAAAPFVYTLF